VVSVQKSAKLKDAHPSIRKKITTYEKKNSFFKNHRHSLCTLKKQVNWWYHRLECARVKKEIKKSINLFYNNLWNFHRYQISCSRYFDCFLNLHKNFWNIYKKLYTHQKSHYETVFVCWHSKNKTIMKERFHIRNRA